MNISQSFVLIMSGADRQERWKHEFRITSGNYVGSLWVCSTRSSTYIVMYIRRPRPSPRQGRRLGPPQVWSLFLLACYYLAFCQALRPLPCVLKGVQACRLPGLKCLKRCAAASSRHSGHCPLLLRAFKPAVCQASNASNAERQLRAGTQATALCC